MTKTVVLSDLQGYKIDRRAWRATLAFLADFKPDQVVLAGDIVEFGDISSYRKHPNERMRLDKECRFVREVILQPLKKLADFSAARMVFLEGNHEDRLHRYLCDRAPELYGAMATVPELLELDSFGIEWHGKKPLWLNKHLVVVHGEISRKFTAAAMMDRYKCSGISGHCHRMQVHYGAGINREWVWTTCGHMEDPKKIGWLAGVSEWSQGFVVCYDHGGGRFHLEQAKIVKGSVYYGADVWKP